MIAKVLNVDDSGLEGQTTPAETTGEGDGPQMQQRSYKLTDGSETDSPYKYGMSKRLHYLDVKELSISLNHINDFNRLNKYISRQHF